MNHLLCFGMGYSARALADLLRGDDWRITGTATSPVGIERIAKRGEAGVMFDGTGPSALIDAALVTATHLVISIPPGDAGDPVLVHHAKAIERAPKLRWIGYLSTVGVYGDHQGAWVDETTPATPGSVRSRRRLEAENAWQDIGQRAGKQIQVFRLAGIYGPGRSAIDNLRAGQARRIVKQGQVFNRIHVADIAAVVAAAMTGAGRHTVYNVADDEPAPPQDVIAFAAALLGIAPPPEIQFEEAQLSEMGRSFYAENKRVANGRIKHDLGVRLRFATFREGMRAILAGK